MIAGLLALVACSAGGSDGVAACRPDLWSDIPVDVSHSGVALIGARVDGRPATMVLDTGAETTVITADAASRLGVERSFEHPRTMQGASGQSVGGLTVPVTFSFGDVGTRGARLIVGVFPLPVVAGEQLDGLLGADLLGATDVDLDLPHGRIRLYRPLAPECGPPRATTLPPGFGADPAIVPMAPGPLARVVLPVALNGHMLLAVLDSGASASTVSLRGAAAAGVSADDLEHAPSISTHAASETLFSAHLHRFDELQVGPESTARPVLLVGPLDLGQPDMLLGLDYLRAHRVYLAFATRRVVIAPAGR